MRLCSAFSSIQGLLSANRSSRLPLPRPATLFFGPEMPSRRTRHPPRSIEGSPPVTNLPCLPCPAALIPGQSHRLPLPCQATRISRQSRPSDNCFFQSYAAHIHPLLTLVKIIVLSWASNLEESWCALADLDLFTRPGQPRPVDSQLHPLLRQFAGVATPALWKALQALGIRYRDGLEDRHGDKRSIARATTPCWRCTCSSQRRVSARNSARSSRR